jgi:hypothetical protein
MAVGTGAIAARLLDGRVLVAGGGNGCDQAVNTAALFDPASNRCTTTASMASPRQWHRALLLADGRVLVAGGARQVGSNLTAAEVFDPVSATWAGAAGPFDATVLSQLGVLDSGRTFASITALADGRVLAAGGYDESATLLASAAVLDPTRGTWTPTSPLTMPRARQTATRLANGLGVLIVGGIDELGPSRSADIFHPVPALAYQAFPPGIGMVGSPTSSATNSHGHLYVSFRLNAIDGRSRIFEYVVQRSDDNLFGRMYGKPIRAFGAKIDGRVHTLRIDRDDNVWAVIEETNTILKFSAEGRLLMRLFPPPDPPDGVVDDPLSGSPPPPQPYRFDRPTDVGWDRAGNIFVVDGHRNSRVVKYDKDGRFLAAAGSRGSAPGEMNTPHSLVVDAAGNVYVADSGNSRIQVFDNNLNLHAIYDTVGTPWALCITEGPHQYLFSASNLTRRDQPPERFLKAEIYKMEHDGRVLGRIGYADSTSLGI